MPVPGFVKVAEKKDLLPGDARTVTVAGRPLALFNVGGTFHALDNTCLHRGGPLGEGSLEDKVVTCPWHGWTYDVTTGDCLTRPGGKVSRHEVRLEGEDVLVSEQPTA